MSDFDADLVEDKGAWLQTGAGAIDTLQSAATEVVTTRQAFHFDLAAHQFRRCALGVETHNSPWALSRQLHRSNTYVGIADVYVPLARVVSVDAYPIDGHRLDVLYQHNSPFHDDIGVGDVDTQSLYVGWCGHPTLVVAIDADE